MKKWLAPEMLDMHGYVTPTLIEATTKPHNPSIEYDLWLKWNQPRIDYNEAALNAIGQQVTRPINDWCPEGDAAVDGRRPLRRRRDPPGPDVAEGWDDWGPFYGPMYHQHVGLDSSTVEMCSSTTVAAAAAPARAQIQNVVQSSTHRVRRRQPRAGCSTTSSRCTSAATLDAPRPACCPAPFDPEFHNWMLDYPQAYVIPVGEGQRSDAEANRLVEWMLVQRHRGRARSSATPRSRARRFEEGSYVVWMKQPRRGLADTALSIGVDISPRIQRLYAPPAAWSHGYLWGADTVTIPDGARLQRAHRRGSAGRTASSGGARVRHEREGLHARGRLADRGARDQRGAERGREGVARDRVARARARPARSSSRTDSATKNIARGRRRGQRADVQARRPDRCPPASRSSASPRIAVLTGAVNQDVWSLRELGFTADPISTATINTAPTDPLAGYDVIYNTGSGFPAASNATGRARLDAFFAAGGGYVGAQTAGVNFLNGSGNPATGDQVTGLTAANRGGNGRSGIVYWDNTGGAASVDHRCLPGPATRRSSTRRRG